MKLTTFTTSYNGQEKENRVEEKEFIMDSERESQLLILYPQVTYQVFEGFGGAVTDSAGYVYSMMNPEQKQTLLKEYFTTSGLQYQHVRLPLDSCDFSLGYYEAMSNPDDSEMKSFSMERTEKYILPLVDDIQRTTSKDIPIMVTPWSPPAFMKTNGKRNEGGKLKEEYHELWAKYLCRYIMELRNRGYQVNRMSIQNEPKASQTWDSCIFTAEEERDFLKNYLYPELCRNKLNDMEIYIWDHNKERLFDRACTIIDKETEQMIAGIAFHWYSGDHFEELQMVHEKFPDMKLILSEACIEFTKFSEENFLDNAEKYAHDMIGNLNHGMTAFYDWNLLLDEKGGPNHVQNYCDAPFRFHTGEKVLIEGTIAAYVGHFSHYIQPNAVRIGHSRYSDKIEMTAWRNPDGTIAVVVLNRTKESVVCYLKVGDYCAEWRIEPQSMATGMVEGSDFML